MTEEHIFIFVTTTSAHLIPLRAFADGRAFDAFADAAKRYHGMPGAHEDGEREHPRSTGILAPDQSGKSGTVEGIIPKERG